MAAKTYPEEYTFIVDLDHDVQEERTPRRVPMACLFCRRRKVRCDGQATCSNCDRRKIACVYVPVSETAEAAQNVTKYE